MLYESGLIEAIYEVIANTEFKEDADALLSDFRSGDTDFELDRANAKITIRDNDSGVEYTITASRTHASKPIE